MLGLDQAKCLYRLLFISLIACSSPKVPLWTVIKEPFMNRGQIQLEGKGDASCMFCGRIFFFSLSTYLCRRGFKMDSYFFDIGWTRCIFFHVVTRLRSFSSKHKERAVLCQSIFMCTESWMKQRKNQSAVKAVSQKHTSNDASIDVWVFSATVIPMISGFNNNDNYNTRGFILRGLSVSQTKMIILKNTGLLLLLLLSEQ